MSPEFPAPPLCARCCIPSGSIQQATTCAGNPPPKEELLLGVGLTEGDSLRLLERRTSYRWPPSGRLSYHPSHLSPCSLTAVGLWRNTSFSLPSPIFRMTPKLIQSITISPLRSHDIHLRGAAPFSRGKQSNPISPDDRTLVRIVQTQDHGKPSLAPYPALASVMPPSASGLAPLPSPSRTDTSNIAHDAHASTHHPQIQRL